MALDAERLVKIQGELERALRTRWKKRLLEFEFRLEGLRLCTDGERFHLLADSGRLKVTRGTIGDLPVAADLEIGAVELDYAQLGVGRIAPVAPVPLRIEVRITMDDLDRLIAKGGFVDAEVREGPETGRLRIAATRPIRFLLFRFFPRVELDGILFQEETRIGVRDLGVRIRGLPRFVERIVQGKLRERIGRPIELEDEYAKLARQGLRVLGGSVELTGRSGTIVRREVPGPAVRPADGSRG